ncbi:MAG TPA: hypothetical protein VM032_10065 [Vicinamibacterales bacterium]|nr:hypothetical protein [Vicinamibacterales bacterium]
MSVEKLTERIRAEFDEMPELMLTMPQASKFFGIEQDLMHSVTERLMKLDYLRKTSRGALVRAAR